ncbi:MAG: ABC transporter ATP-binding protein, partial [Mobilitalea sp.]
MISKPKKYMDIFKIVWFFFKPYKSRIILVYISMFIASLFETINLAALYPILSYGLQQEPKGVILQQFNRVIYFFGGKNLFLSSCIVLIIITVLAILFRYINYLLQYRLLASIDIAIQRNILDKYLKADYAFFVKSQQGKLIHTATIAPTSVGNMVLYTARLINDATTFILMVIFLIILSWQATIIVALIGIVYFLFVRKIMTKIIYRCGLLAVEANRMKNIILNELINGIKPIKVFLSHGLWEEKYADAVNKSVGNQFKMLMGRFFPESFIKATSFFLLAAIGIFVYIKTGGNMVSLIPTYGILALVVTRLSPLANLIGSDFMILAESLPNTRIIHELLNETTCKIKEGTKIFTDFKKDISFEDVWFKYAGIDKYIIQNASFTAQRRKITALVGLSGSGKTTIINLILRLYDLDKGSIKIDGVDISEYSLESLLTKIGYVSQETFIYNDTISENIRFGMRNCADEKIMEAAKQANAHDFIMGLPNGYDTIVGDSGVKLSGGQRQRIAIARAVLRKPEIMILDEA